MPSFSDFLLDQPQQPQHGSLMKTGRVFPPSDHLTGGPPVASIGPQQHTGRSAQRELLFRIFERTNLSPHAVREIVNRLVAPDYADGINVGLGDVLRIPSMASSAADAYLYARHGDAGNAAAHALAAAPLPGAGRLGSLHRDFSRVLLGETADGPPRNAPHDELSPPPLDWPTFQNELRRLGLHDRAAGANHR